MRMTRTFGAPAGGRSWRIGGYFVSGAFASNGVSPAGVISGMGRTCLWTVSRAVDELFFAIAGLQPLLPHHREAKPLLGADHVVDVLGRCVDVDLHPVDGAAELVAARPVVR